MLFYQDKPWLYIIEQTVSAGEYFRAYSWRLNLSEISYRMMERKRTDGNKFV